jgi:hypothetical protein
MYAARLAIAFLIGFWSLAGHAADLSLKDLDCAKILERWARDPASVPKHMVDRCKEQMAEAAPPVAPLPQAAAVDPCTGPNAAASVLCWGPWAVLAPAAESPAATLAMPAIAIDCSSGADISDQCVPQLQAQEVVTGCAPGTPCGFATLVAGALNSADVEDTSFVRFDLATDGTSFTVDPDGANEINSVPMTTGFSSHTDNYENMGAIGVADGELSALVTRVVRGDEGSIQLAADAWLHGNIDTRVAQSGYFAWGTATSQSGLNALNSSGVSVVFRGPMSVDNSTNALMTVNFGTQPNWTGTWTNPAWSFGAGGSVTGANLMSNPAQFTANVESGSFVQGALLGEPGGQGLAHIIDVRLANQGHIKDVGLLRQAPN